MKNPIKMNDLVVPVFQETTTCSGSFYLEETATESKCRAS